MSQENPYHFGSGQYAKDNRFFIIFVHLDRVVQVSRLTREVFACNTRNASFPKIKNKKFWVILNTIVFYYKLLKRLLESEVKDSS